MVTICLALQIEGDLTKEMLDNLVDVFEILTPEMRLIVLLNDLKTYNELKQLTELLIQGASMPSTGTKELEETTLENLKVDIAENIREKKAINEIQ